MDSESLYKENRNGRRPGPHTWLGWVPVGPRWGIHGREAHWQWRRPRAKGLGVPSTSPAPRRRVCECGSVSLRACLAVCVCICVHICERGPPPCPQGRVSPRAAGSQRWEVRVSPQVVPRAQAGAGQRSANSPSPEPHCQGLLIWTWWTPHVATSRKPPEMPSPLALALSL